HLNEIVRCDRLSQAVELDVSARSVERRLGQCSEEALKIGKISVDLLESAQRRFHRVEVERSDEVERHVREGLSEVVQEPHPRARGRAERHSRSAEDTYRRRPQAARPCCLYG